MLKDFVLVEKEDVPNFVFPADSLKLSEIEQEKLMSELHRANSLGNLEHHKVKIYFEDDKGKKMVDTTIWAVTEEAIVLKQNVLLPIRRIYKLEI